MSPVAVVSSPLRTAVLATPRSAPLSSRRRSEALDAGGYGTLTLADVARRAGTTKPAIYRRWATRQHLVLAALAARLGEAQAPDTSCTLRIR